MNLIIVSIIIIYQVNKCDTIHNKMQFHACSTECMQLSTLQCMYQRCLKFLKKKSSFALCFVFVFEFNNKRKKKDAKRYGSELDTTEKLLQNTHRGQCGILRAKVATM